MPRSVLPQFNPTITTCKLGDLYHPFLSSYSQLKEKSSKTLAHAFVVHQAELVLATPTSHIGVLLWVLDMPCCQFGLLIMHLYHVPWFLWPGGRSKWRSWHLAFALLSPGSYMHLECEREDWRVCVFLSLLITLFFKSVMKITLQ